MNIDDLTIGQAKELTAAFGGSGSIGLNDMIGQKCIVRTCSAGVWFGRVKKKAGNEVIVAHARRLWRWETKESISLSAVAKYGITYSGSKIAPAVDSVWLEAIELIPTTTQATKSIEGAEDAVA